jgi:hypothetical protein
MIDQRTISEQHHRKQYQQEQQQMEKEIDWCLKMMDEFYYLKGDQFKRKCIICVITRKKHTSEHKNQYELVKQKREATIASINEKRMEKFSGCLAIGCYLPQAFYLLFRP